MAKLTESMLRKLIKQQLKEAIDSNNYKVVYNSGVGGFSLSPRAIARLKQLGASNEADLKRHDPRLVQVVEELGDQASGRHSNLRVATINSALYKIDESDGDELVVTPDSIEWIKID